MVSINAKLLDQKKASNYHWIGLEHHHGRRDVMYKRSEQCYASFFFGGGEERWGGGAGEVNKGQGYNKLDYDLPE